MSNRNFARKEKTVRGRALRLVSNGSVVPRHTMMPWSCRHLAGRSEIEAYIEASGKREMIAEVKSGAGVDAEIASEFIARAVNDYEKSKDLIRHMAAALEQCLACDLTWEAEFEADAMVRRARELSS